MTVLEILPGQHALNRGLTFQEPVHDFIAVFVDIDVALYSAQLPQHRVWSQMGKRELAPGINDAANDHGQSRSHPGLMAGIEQMGQIQRSG